MPDKSLSFVVENDLLGQRKFTILVYREPHHLTPPHEPILVELDERKTSREFRCDMGCFGYIQIADENEPGQFITAT